MAGPGSGKTRVLTSRIAHLLLQPPQEDRVLALTFTRKAASEMKNRLKKLLLQQHADASSSSVADAVDRQLRRVTLGTFHYVCAKMLRYNADRLPTLPSVLKHGSDDSAHEAATLDSNFSIADQNDQLRLVGALIKERQIAASPETQAREIIRGISLAKEAFARGEDPFEKSKAVNTVVQTLYHPYRQALFSNNQVDFDDLIQLTRELLVEEKDIRNWMQQLWTHVMVDEFQDTSKSQLELVRLLTTNSLFVVGDPDQSIYSWRGANVGIMQECEAALAHCAGSLDTVYLMENYRCTANIVKAAQKVINSGNAKWLDGNLRKDMIPMREAGAIPRILSFRDSKEEANCIVRAIQDAISEGTYSSNTEVAILFRTNAQSRAIEEACVQLNLPYVLHGSATRFYERQEVKDCLAYLRWLANGRDQGSMLRAMATPSRNIGVKTQAEFDKYCEAVVLHYQQLSLRQPTTLEILLSISDSYQLDGATPKAAEHLRSRSLKSLRLFSEQMACIQDFALSNPLAALLIHITETVGLFAHWDKISKSTDEFVERRANVVELQHAASRYRGPSLGKGKDQNESTNDDGQSLSVDQSPLASFLEDVALVTDMSEQSSSNEPRCVASLMTIHASKGMEFDSVFIVGNEHGTFPTQHALKMGIGSDELEEEKRLFYVAVTRAKDDLVLSWRKEVWTFAPPKASKAWTFASPTRRSHFLDLLDRKPTSKNKLPATDTD